MLSEPMTTFFTSEEIAAMALLHRMGVDVTRTYQFWEALVARIADGKRTEHRCAWDIEVGDARVEVKSSAEFQCKFADTGARPVFKFALEKDSINTTALRHNYYLKSCARRTRRTRGRLGAVAKR